MKSTLEVSTLHCRSPPTQAQNSNEAQAVLVLAFSRLTKTAFLTPFGIMRACNIDTQVRRCHEETDTRKANPNHIGAD